MEHYKKRKRLSQVKAAITVFFVLGMLLRVGLSIRDASGQALPDEPAAESVTDEVLSMSGEEDAAGRGQQRQLRRRVHIIHAARPVMFVGATVTSVDDNQ